MKRSGTTLLEVLFVSVGMLVMLFPVLMVMSAGMSEAKVSADEFQAALLLGEMGDQVALIRRHELPEEDGILDLREAGRHTLRADRAGAWLELSPLPASFEIRELSLEAGETAADPRRVRMRVGYRRPRGTLKIVESMVLVHPAHAGSAE